MVGRVGVRAGQCGERWPARRANTRGSPTRTRRGRISESSAAMCRAYEGTCGSYRDTRLQGWQAARARVARDNGAASVTCPMESLSRPRSVLVTALLLLRRSSSEAVTRRPVCKIRLPGSNVRRPRACLDERVPPPVASSSSTDDLPQRQSILQFQTGVRGQGLRTHERTRLLPATGAEKGITPEDLQTCAPKRRE